MRVWKSKKEKIWQKYIKYIPSLKHVHHSYTLEKTINPVDKGTEDIKHIRHVNGKDRIGFKHPERGRIQVAGAFKLSHKPRLRLYPWVPARHLVVTYISFKVHANVTTFHFIAIRARQLWWCRMMYIHSGAGSCSVLQVLVLFSSFQTLMNNVWYPFSSVQFSCSVRSDSATPRTAACQASLSIINSQSLLKLMSIE